MSKEDKKEPENDKKESGEVTRREFLKDAGFVVGGAAIGAGIAWPLASDGDGETITETITVTETVDVPTFRAPDGATFDTFEALVTYMEGLPGGVTVIDKFICPYDDQEFATLALLETHLNTLHGGETKVDPGNGGTVVQAIPGAVTLTINGEARVVVVEPEWSMAFVLKEKLGLTGAKIGCDRGECGTCSIIVNGRTALSCTMLAIEGEGLDILTIEGLADGATLHPVQQRFVDNATFQCGYCTPGMIMSAVALIDRNPNPTVDEAKEAISGNLCYCSDYTRVLATIANIPINVEIGGN
jgi:aerobic-type carbon monoxide dehydrogenase small subunit (CoxS/CutS family)